MLAARGFHFYQGEAKWLARGVTYGPFRPDEGGLTYPGPDQIRRDFAAISAMGANALRLYNVPDERLATLAAEYGLMLLIDIPWPKHIHVYGVPANERLCLGMVEESVARVSRWPNVLGVFVGNEIPADLVRWAGARRVERFLRRLYGRAKHLAPDLPVGFANFPPTEYLELGFFDFLGFNVYLHTPKDFRGYLLRLRYLYPEKPLLLSEFGLDTQRHTPAEQARLLSENLGAAYEVGMAGAFVFAWTDEWHTGGYDVEEWSFGLTDHDRRPKPSLAVVSQVFRSAPQCTPLPSGPKISVVVATYNGGRTLRPCLESLRRLRYPDYEVIVADDGSTDDTPEILRDFPDLHVITQDNRGLSAARNAGIEAATGEIVAFTDSDCFVDRDWLYHLAAAFERENIAGAGGPNLTPEDDGAAARAVARAPGHATHVLLPNDEVEHVPGCNMAFRRSVLLSVNGFDPVFRKAGDDVDVIWRMQDMGYRIGFAPAAFVWHHRRPTLRAYWKQQMGYGEAEALLIRKHANRFNDLGQSVWRGRIYASPEAQPLLGRPNIRYGIFGSAGYQCIYQRPGNRLVHRVASCEWWFFSLCLIVLGLYAAPALTVGLIGVALAAGVGGLRAWRRIEHEPAGSKRLLPLIALLWTTQPIVRGLTRYWSRLGIRPPAHDLPNAARSASEGRKLHFWRTRVLEHWGEQAPSRLEVLRRLVSELTRLQWIYTTNTEWEPWDLSVALSAWFKVRVVSAEEHHGGTKRLLRFRLGLVPTTLFYILVGAGLAVSGAVAFQDTILSRTVLVVLLLILWAAYRQGLTRRFAIEDLIHSVAANVGYEPLGRPAEAPAPGRNPLAQTAF